MNARSFQWGGLAATLGGIFWTNFYLWLSASQADRVDLLLLRSPALSAGLVVSSILMGTGFLSLYRARPAGGSKQMGLLLGLIGIGSIAAGLFATAILGWRAAWSIGIVGEALVSAGLAIFGIANLSLRLFVRGNALPLLMAAIYVPSWIVDPGSLPTTIPSSAVELLGALYGFGWFLLGLLIWRGRAASPGRNSAG